MSELRAEVTPWANAVDDANEMEWAREEGEPEVRLFSAM
jgi:hypothetical protein